MDIRALMPRAAVIVLLAVTVGCATARQDAARSDPERLLQQVFEKGSADANSLQFEGDEASCAAKKVVDGLGARRLQELGLDVPSGKGPTLTVPPLTSAEGHQVFAAFEQCLDLVDQLAGPFARDADLSRTQARCVAKAYLRSGVLEAAVLAPAFDDALNGRIDGVVTSAITACTPT
jgi:hypothetical protein